MVKTPLFFPRSRLEHRSQSPLASLQTSPVRTASLRLTRSPSTRPPTPSCTTPASTPSTTPKHTVHFVDPVLIKDGVIVTKVSQFLSMVHCIEILIYVTKEKEMRGISPNFHIHVSVSDLSIPNIGPPVSLLQDRQTDAQRNMNGGIGTVAAQLLFWEYLFRISVLCLCSVLFTFSRSYFLKIV